MRAVAVVAMLLCAVVASALLGKQAFGPGAVDQPGPTVTPRGSATAPVPSVSGGTEIIRLPPLPVVDATAQPGPSDGPGPPTALPVIAAISAEEAWFGASIPASVWHYLDGSWTVVPLAPLQSSQYVNGLSGGADGVLAVATELGAAVLADGRWTVLQSGMARAALLAPDGTIWVARPSPSDELEAIVSSYRREDGAWARRDLPPVPSSNGITSLVVDHQGGLWLGSGGYWGWLEHFDGKTWDHVALEGGDVVNVGGIAIAPNGDVWATVGLSAVSGDSVWVLARHDVAGTWAVFHDVRPPGGTQFPFTVAITADGTPWIGFLTGLSRFDPERGTTVPLAPSGQTPEMWAVSGAPDGAFWAWTSSGVERVRPDSTPAR